MSDAPEFPIIVAEWRRNTRESIRIALDRFNGRHTIDVRAWWQDGVGNLRPSRGGITIAVRHLPALADGLAAALQQARALGLIEPAPTSGKDRTAADRQRGYRARHRNGKAGVTPDMEA